MASREVKPLQSRPSRFGLFWSLIVFDGVVDQPYRVVVR